MYLELRLCHQLWFLNPYIFTTWRCRLLIFQTLIFIYQIIYLSMIMVLENQNLWQWLNSFIYIHYSKSYFIAPLALYFIDYIYIWRNISSVIHIIFICTFIPRFQIIFDFFERLRKTLYYIYTYYITQILNEHCLLNL